MGWEVKLLIILFFPSLCVALVGVVAGGPVARPAAASVLASMLAVGVSAAVPKDQWVNLGGRVMRLSSAPAWAAVLDALITLSSIGAGIVCGLWAAGVLP